MVRKEAGDSVKSECFSPIHTHIHTHTNTYTYSNKLSKHSSLVHLTIELMYFDEIKIKVFSFRRDETNTHYTKRYT